MPRRSSFARGRGRKTRVPKLEEVSRPIIALLSDFGTADGYVAAMKASILTLCPRATHVDISHDVPAFDIRSAAYILKTVFSDFPPRTIFLAIVDPGVGSERRPLAIRTACGRLLVGPDNGLFSWVLRDRRGWEARVLQDSTVWKPQVSSTFHGRDLFAPVAAHLACGGVFRTLGPVCRPLMGDWTVVGHRGGNLQGQVIHVDRFGNLVTNITREDLGSGDAEAGWAIELSGFPTGVALSRTYSSLPVGGVGALVGSSGHLEIAVNQGSAARTLGLGPGSGVKAWRRCL